MTALATMTTTMMMMAALGVDGVHHLAHAVVVPPAAVAAAVALDSAVAAAQLVVQVEAAGVAWVDGNPGRASPTAPWTMTTSTTKATSCSWRGATVPPCGQRRRCGSGMKLRLVVSLRIGHGHERRRWPPLPPLLARRQCTLGGMMAQEEAASVSVVVVVLLEGVVVVVITCNRMTTTVVSVVVVSVAVVVDVLLGVVLLEVVITCHRMTTTAAVRRCLHAVVAAGVTGRACLPAARPRDGTVTVMRTARCARTAVAPLVAAVLVEVLVITAASGVTSTMEAPAWVCGVGFPQARLW